ncbi:hypothetical protein ACQEU3_41460 [Spirillospora sp. CA-253888]
MLQGHLDLRMLRERRNPARSRAYGVAGGDGAAGPAVIESVDITGAAIANADTGAFTTLVQDDHGLAA